MSSLLPASTIQRVVRHFGVMTLVLLGTIALPVASGAQPCPLPPQYTNSASVMVGDLRFILATETYLYAVGDPVSIIMTVENTGSGSVTIPNPSMISPLQALWVVADTCATFYVDDCPSVSPFYWPQSHYYFGVSIVLAPGECRTYTQTWNGVPWQGGTAQPGFYAVLGGMSRGSTLFMPQGGVRLPIQIGEQGVPTDQRTWGAIKSLYR